METNQIREAIREDVGIASIPFLKKNGLTYYLKIPMLTTKKGRYIDYLWEFGDLEALISNEEGDITGLEYSHLSDEIDFTDYIVDEYKDIAESLWYIYFLKIRAAHSSCIWLVDKEEGDERYDKVINNHLEEIDEFLEEINERLYSYFDAFYKLIRQENSKHCGIKN